MARDDEDYALDCPGLAVAAVLPENLVRDHRLQVDVLDVGRAPRTMLDGILGNLFGLR